MYQWTDPDSGHTHLSGSPPAWYRSDADGPRVFVFEKGQLIDDTGVTVSDEKRRQLRQQALVETAEDRDSAKRQAEEAASLGRQLDSTAEGDAGPPAISPPPASDTEPEEAEADTAGTDSEQGLSADQVAALRALVADWEERQQQQAQDLLEENNSSSQSADGNTDEPPVSREQLQRYLDQQTDEQPAP